MKEKTATKTWQILLSVPAHLIYIPLKSARSWFRKEFDL